LNTHFEDADTKSWELPSEHSADDVRLSEDVLKKYICSLTQPGDLVFDPFAGFGTTLVVAERLERRGLGYEILEARARYANSIISSSSNVICSDIQNIELDQLPLIDLCISSPPYMNKTDAEDPLSGYADPIGTYEEYIAKLRAIYTSIGKRLNEDGHLVIQIQNLQTDQGITPLAFDLYNAIGSDLAFVSEDITIWDTKCYGYTHGYCFIYRGD